VRRKGINDNTAKFMKEMYNGIKFREKSLEKTVTDFIEQKREVRQDFDIFMDYMVDN
jgi:hypothetical protein